MINCVSKNTENRKKVKFTSETRWKTKNLSENALRNVKKSNFVSKTTTKQIKKAIFALKKAHKRKYASRKLRKEEKAKFALKTKRLLEKRQNSPQRS